MDKPIRKFVLWKCRNIKKMQENLVRMQERMQEIIDEGAASVADGVPKSKYNVMDIVTNKVIRREQVEFSMKKIQYEIQTLQEFQKSLSGYEKEVYEETIAKQGDIIAKADFLGVSKNKLCEDRSKLIRQLATRLGEYVDND